MIMKKLFLIFLFSGILGCFCRDIPEHWNMEDFEIEVFEKDERLPSENIIKMDSAFMRIQYTADFVEALPLNSLSLINSAYGFSCPDDGFLGLNDQVISLNFTSNADFNEIKAGESLNNIIFLDRFIFSNSITSVDKIIEILNETDPFNSKFVRFVITEKPESNSKHRFKIRFEFKSGKILEKETEEFQWE